MRRDPILAVLSACLLASAPCYAQAIPHDGVEVMEARPERSPDEKVPDLAAVTKSLFGRTNAFREKEKRAPVKVEAKLAETAKYFADYMARTDRYGHQADGHDPGTRATTHKYEFGLISENIAYSFNTVGFAAEELAGQLEVGWENSPGHRKNMLDPDVTDAGMAVARSEKTGYYYAVQMFARPKSLNVHVEIVNQTEATISYKFAGQAFTLMPRYSQFHEQGRPGELIVELPSVDDKKPVTKTFKAAEGKSRFVISEDKGALQVKKE